MKQFFSQTQISHRLGWAFGFVVVSGLVGSLVSRSVLHEVSGTTRTLVDEHMAAVSDIGLIKDNLGQVARSTRNLLLTQAAEQQAERAAIDQALALNAQTYAELERRALDAYPRIAQGKPRPPARHTTHSCKLFWSRAGGDHAEALSN